jgi:alkylhydroperoxidase/carboxymuconolactone decarboxylase family protein YurZ
MEIATNMQHFFCHQSPELTEWVRYDDFGHVFGRAGLSLIEREAIVIGVLIAQGVPQIDSHHRAML